MGRPAGHALGKTLEVDYHGLQSRVMSLPPLVRPVTPGSVDGARLGPKNWGSGKDAVARE